MSTPITSHFDLIEAYGMGLPDATLTIPDPIWEKIHASEQFLHAYLADGEKTIYGVNTGFGSLCDVRIDDADLSELQSNLLITHAAGVGTLLPQQIVKTMLFLKLLNLSKGHSAVSKKVVERLLYFYNRNLIPVVHSQGSLGASGDLAPLAEMCLPLIGKGSFYDASGNAISTKEILDAHQMAPIELGPKEALALINGTQFMLAHAVVLAFGIQQILANTEKIAASSADVWLCKEEPFLPPIHTIRKQKHQQWVAEEMLQHLKQGAFRTLAGTAVQDPYSFRCIPQVHGASRAAFAHCLEIWQNELEAVTDNPNVFPVEGQVLSGGNFHGQPLALTLDYAAIALAELANISERRTYLLISGQRGLPPYLADDAGLDSGYMIAQYTAASLVSQNKQWCTPASVDSIVSSNGQEDHVSMGANAAIKALNVLRNTQQVLSIEWMCAQRAHFLRKWIMEEGEKMPPLGRHRQTPMHELIAEVAKELFG